MRLESVRQRLVATAKGVPCHPLKAGGWKRIAHGIRPGDRSSIWKLIALFLYGHKVEALPGKLEMKIYCGGEESPRDECGSRLKS